MERMPIIVTTNDIEKLLGVPTCDNKSGEAIAQSVHESLSNWLLLEKIQGMCFDTTSANTGVHKGACHILEKMLGRELLYFACRHHVSEIVVRGAFEAKFGKTKAPEVKFLWIFKKHGMLAKSNQMIIKVASKIRSFERRLL